MIDANIRQVAEEEMAATAKATTLAAHEQAATAIRHGIIEAVVANEVRLAAVAALEEAEKAARERIARLAAKCRRGRIVRCFRAWATQARKSRDQRRALLNFPAGPATFDAVEQNERLAIGLAGGRPQTARSLSQVVRLRADWNRQLRAAEDQEAAVQAAILQPFHILAMLENSPFGKFSKNQEY
jgi:hypothetical protein